MDYTYSKDLLSAISTASGTDYSFTYGVFDLTTAVKAGSRTLISHSYTNDQNRRLSRSVYGNGDAVSYSYDSFGRTTAVTYGDTGSTVSYAYDANSSLGQLTDGISGRVNRYSYDFLDRLMRYEESGDGYSNIVQWGYDDENNLSSQTQTLNGSTYASTYAYDKDNRLTKATEGTISANYTYDSFSRMSLFINAYDGDNTLTTSIGYRNPSSTSTSSQVSTWKVRPYGRTTYLYNGSYTYDTRGNILTVSDGTYTNSYHYDKFDRLVREDHGASGKTWVYTYDDGGNILSKKEYAYTTGALGTVRSTISYSYNNSEWRDLLTAYNGKSISYDAIGNPLNDGMWTYAWQHGRQLASMSKSGSSITYGYNADGKRISKTINGTTYNYAYLGDALTDLSWGSNRMHFTYDSLGPASVTYNGTTYLYVKNAQGDVVQIVDGNGNTVVTYIYDAWGNMLYHYGSHVDDIGKYNPFRYRGYVYDTETGLYYLSSRYYNPAWGRFINADTAAVVAASPDKANWDKNLFAYCDNNPISRKDDGGEFWHLVVGAVAGALISGVVKTISNRIEGKSLTDGLATAMLAGAASGVLAATGIGIAGMVTGSAALSMAENAANQVIKNKGFNNFNVGDMLIDGAIGGALGAVGGAGKGTKHLMNLGTQSVNRTFNVVANRGFKAGLKEAGKALAYYGKSSAKYYKEFAKGLPSDVFSTVAATIASSGYMKYQYRRIFER